MLSKDELVAGIEREIALLEVKFKDEFKKSGKYEILRKIRDDINEKKKEINYVIQSA